MAPYGRKMYKQSSLYYGNPEDFTKRVYYARFGCPTYSDKAVQGHTAHTTGGAEQTAATVEVLDRGGVHASWATLRCGTAGSCM